MWNARPLVLDLRIVFLAESIVLLVQVSIEFIEEITGQDFSILICLMDSMFKLSELSLTEDCSTETVQEVIEDSKACRIVFYFFQQFLCQDVFIGR